MVERSLGYRVLLVVRASALALTFFVLPLTAQLAEPERVFGANGPQDQRGRAIVSGEFRGDGIGDFAIGIPGSRDVGRVSVHRLGEGTGFFLTLGSNGIAGEAEEGSQFGWSLASGDFDGDGFDDLAAGAPKKDGRSSTDAGIVAVFYGPLPKSPVERSEIWSQERLGELAEDNDNFGWSLAVGDFNRDGFDDLAVGAPFETTGSGRAGSPLIPGAGEVNVIYGSSNGLTNVGDQVWNQESDGILGSGENNDQFGRALTAGDFNGDGYDDLAVGVPSEDVGSGRAGAIPPAENAGEVRVLYGSSSGLRGTGSQLWRQGSDGVTGAAETRDNFGWSLAAGDFDRDGIDDLAIGVPGQDIGPSTEMGVVNVLYGTATGLSGDRDQVWLLAFLGSGVQATSGDRFGTGLAVGDFQNDVFDDLAVGAPGLQGGRVGVIYGAVGGLTIAGSQVLTLPENDPGAQFGLALGAMNRYQGGVNDDLLIGAPLADGTRGAVFRSEGSPHMATVNAASFAADRPVAPASIVSLFGAALAPDTALASETPLPTELLGTSVEIKDSKGDKRPAGLFFVSPGQVNYLIPPKTALGAALATVTRDNGLAVSHRILVNRISPALFTANAQGTGVAVGLAIRVKPGGEQSIEFLSDPATGKPVPINMQDFPRDEVFLALFGTGIRGSGETFSARITRPEFPTEGEVKLNLNVLAAVPQGEFVGLDQINLGPLPRRLGGEGGGLPVTFFVRLFGGDLLDFKATNFVEVQIR